jgi:hypothetical protein
VVEDILMARLSIAPAPVIAAPTPTIAKKIEDWDAKANPATPQIVVPVVTPLARPKISPAAAFRGFLGRLFPKLLPIADVLVLPPYIAALVDQGFAPAEGPAEDWALLEAWGHFELAQTRKGLMSGQPPGEPLTGRGLAAGLRTRPVEHFTALVLQARGWTGQSAATAAYALKASADEYLKVLTPGWRG